MSLADDIAANAAKARRMKSGTEERESHPLKDQIEAARFEASQNALANGGQGFRLQKIRPGGTT